MNGFCCLRIWRGLILGLFLIVSAFVAGAGAASWTHSVTGGYDVWYLNGTTQKFRYNLSNQQWSHFSTVGSSWYTISSTGRSNTFIGNGAWYDMGNGFKYQYSDGYNKGTFKDGLKDRLMYKYGTGQWYHVGDTTHSWQVLGAGGRNGTFIGDGAWYDLGNGFTYKYSAASDKGTFKDGSAYRFLYNYTSGQWYDTGDTLSWQALGNAGLTAAFMGDGRWHDLGNEFDYQFSRGYHKGTFKGDVQTYSCTSMIKDQWWHGGIRTTGTQYPPWGSPPASWGTGARTIWETGGSISTVFMRQLRPAFSPTVWHGLHTSILGMYGEAAGKTIQSGVDCPTSLVGTRPTSLGTGAGTC